MQHKTAGVYRALSKDDKKVTKRERRLGRVVVTPQANYTAAEWRAKKRAESKRRAENGKSNKVQGQSGPPPLGP
jgi:hypothetical protein